MRIESAKFSRSAKDLETCPPAGLPEFAFIGRSNVGKSSLINLLTKQQGLAKVSATPGKTRLINFFTINGAWNLVDLPGYGYAKVSKSDVEGFNEGVSEYLLGRESLKRIFVLIDSRLDPLQADMEFIDWLDDHCSVPIALTFTKIDKVSKSELQTHIAAYIQNLNAWELKVPPILRSSSKTVQGRNEILTLIQKDLPKETAAKKKKQTVSLGWLKKQK